MGEFSAPDVQHQAALAYKHEEELLKSLNINANWAMTDLRNLAKLGSWGQQPNNIHHQLKNLLGEPDAPTPTMFPVEIKKGKTMQGLRGRPGR